MDSCNGKRKTDQIRKLLLDTVGKNPDLFCYYVSIQEAKQLLGQSSEMVIDKDDISVLPRKLTDG